MAISDQTEATTETPSAASARPGGILPTGAVVRSDLLARVFTDPVPRVVLLQAPAGHGKTTFMQQARTHWQAQGAAIGWVSLDEGDNDTSRLFGHLQSLLKRLEAQSTSTQTTSGAIPKVQAGRAPRSDWVVDRLEQLDCRVVVFLDEFQVLTNRSILDFFRTLLERLPDNAIFVIGSRTVPEIGMARLTVNGHAVVLRAQDLRFSLSEAEVFFAGVEGLDLSRKELESIHERSEGWPAALQLYRLSLASPSVRESLTNIATFRPRDLADYLADNVLDLQDAEVQQFLRETALLKRVCAPLCDAVTGRKDSQSMLQFLERAGLFLRSLDADDYWFKYHTLFSGFLARQLSEQNPERTSHIHARAAQWFAEQADYDPAIYHALAGGDVGLAAEILDHWASRLIMDGNLMTVERWYDSLPIGEIEKRPDLVVKVAYALAFLRRRQKLEPIQAILERFAGSGDADLVARSSVVRSMILIIQDDIAGASEVVRTVDVRDDTATGFRAFELGAGANLEGFLAIAAGEPEAAHEYLSLGRAHSERAGAAFSWGYAVSTAGANLLIQGYLQEALEKFRLGMTDPGISLDESVTSAVLVACYVHALYEVDALDEARAQFEQYQSVIRNAALLDYMALSYIALARIHDAQGEAALAQERLDELESIAYSSNWPRLVRNINWERVRRALAQGELDRAKSIASRIDTDPVGGRSLWVPFSEAAEGDLVGCVRLDIADGRCDRALDRLHRALTDAADRRRVRRQIKLRILEALAYRAQGEDNTARRAMQKALSLAAPGGFIRTFIEEGDAAVQLLRDMSEVSSGLNVIAPAAERCDHATPGAERMHNLMHRILRGAGIERAQSAPLEGESFQPLEALTEREQQILTLLANGASNRAMAEAIFVSENTIKFHLKNIYSKLAVSSRAQAINAAHQMGLV